MALVCLSHFQGAFPLGSSGAGELVTRMTRAATPTFFLVSGFVLGFLSFRSPRQFAAIRIKLVDRALFLLSAARIAIIVAHIPIVGLAGALDIVFVTDTIAVCVLVGTVVVPRIGMLGRAALGVSLYAAATCAVMFWIPQSGTAAQFVKHLLVGNRSDIAPNVFLYSFPILQWLAVYLVATSLGERLARARAGGRRTGIAALAGLGALLIGAGLGLWSLRNELEQLPSLAGSGHRVALLLITSPWQKLPPGADFLLCYLGAALLMVSTCLWLERVKPGVLAPFALLGRNSLIVFVAQYFIFYSLIYSLHLAYTPLWPLIFAVSFLVLVPATLAWERVDGQRFLTVGYPGFAAWAGRLRAAR